MERRESKHRRRKDIFVDVDKTLIRSTGKLNTDLVQWCVARRIDGCVLHLWSAKGGQYARDVAINYGVDHLFDLILSKPAYVVDDMGGGWTKYMKIILPAQLDG